MKSTIHWILLGLFFAGAFSGCNTPRIVDDMGGNVFTKGGIIVETNPSGARVYVDEEFVGRAPVRYGVEPGVHRVLIEKRKYNDHEMWITVPKGKTVKEKVKLEKES